eukprot:CAMPEP_0201580886 /NCGR_PEP_ID=MMETSP0190_2-20130828/58285_1 /ASSEMBLY_ACC=CAM_ASM_000263 /TAXON_ID=37353 /ORGANISM="Rosalina sp." /LENGTH=82 /DNA_ID=CAMNT_0048017841 /DNA_START=128 /DNA_END=373 /DNA_ORIENTATION=-
MTINNASKTPSTNKSKSGDQQHLVDDDIRPPALSAIDSTAASDDGTGTITTELPKHRTLNTVASITVFESNNSNDGENGKTD